jgi:hypothetical protein
MILPDQSVAAMRILESIQPQISQHAIVAMILEHAENLQTLDIAMIANGREYLSEWNINRYDHKAKVVQDLFRQNAKDAQDLAAILTRVRDLQSLKALALNGAFFEHSWCSMLSISTLNFGRHCILIPCADMAVQTTANIQTISLEIFALDFAAQTHKQTHRTIMGQFTQPKRLTLHICNTIVSSHVNSPYAEHSTNAIRKIGHPDLDAFVQRYQAGVAGKLERLEIVYHDDVKENRKAAPPLKWRIRPASFAGSTKLRSLRIPHALVLGKGIADVGRLLVGLEELWVTHVNQGMGNVWDVLDALGDEEVSCKELAKVRLSSQAGERLTCDRYMRA